MNYLNTILFFLVHIGLSQALANPLFLSIGSSKELLASGNSSIRVGNSKILKAKALGSQVVVFGQSAGQTTVQLGNRSYRVFVDTEPKIAFLKEALSLLRNFKGIRAKIGQTNTLEINGVLLRMSDWVKLSNIARANGSTYTFSASIHPSIKGAALDLIRDLSLNYGLSESSFHIDPFPAIVVGTDQKDLVESLRKTMRPLGISIEVSMQQLSQLPSVEIEVVLAEVDKTFERELGLRWGDSGKYATQILPSHQWQALNAELTALEARGQGQILAKPRLLSRSGEKAEFHAGGEIPIRMANWGNQSVMWKKHGIILHFQPLADQKGQMKLSLEVEISIPNLSQTVGQLPTFETNRVKSHFDLNKSQTVVISGLIRNSSSELKEGLPYLSQIPVLGRLFGSPRYQSRQTELVIFVTPKVIQPSGIYKQPSLPKGVNL